MSKNCLTKDKLDKAFNLGDENTKSCSRSLVTSSGSKQEIRIDCDREGMKSTGTVKVEAVDSENIKGSMQMTVTQRRAYDEYELYVRRPSGSAQPAPRNRAQLSKLGEMSFQIGRQRRGHRDSLALFRGW